MRIPSAIRTHRTAILNTVVIVAFLYLILPSIEEFRQSFVAIKDASPEWVLFAVFSFFCGMPLMAVQLWRIVLKPVKLWVTYKVQMAALFVNKLLPSGLGLVLINSYFLKVNKHSPTQIASVISVSALTSATAFALLMLSAVILGQQSFDTMRFSSDGNTRWILLGLIIAAIIALITVSLVDRLRTKVIATIRDIRIQLAAYKKRPWDIVIAIVGNGSATMTSVITLFACAAAFDVSITLVDALVVYTLGNVIGNFIPTPGGLGGVDAGLYGGMVVIGVAAGEALTIVLLYRLITYWLAIPVGYTFFWLLKRDVLADFSTKSL